MEKESKLLILTTVLGGILYFMMLLMEMPWMGALALLLISSVYLFYLHKTFRKKTKNKALAKGTGIALALLILIQFVSYGFNYSRSDNQMNLLMDIRGTIERGIMRSSVEKEMLNVFQKYHLEDRDSILAVAEEELGFRMMEDGRYDLTIEGQKHKEDDSLYGSYKKIEEEDELVVRVVSEIAPGKDPEFENANGDTGMQELVFTLNSEGVDYEKQN